MTRRRWIADEFDLTNGRAALTGANADHLIRVLRARVGEEFDVVAGHGAGAMAYHGRIAAISGSRVELELGAVVREPATAPQVSLFLALFKFDRMEWAIEKAVELGVARIVPLVAARSQKHLISAAPKRLERWRRVAHEAVQQARRASQPEICAAVSVAEAIKNESAAGIVLAEDGATATLRESLAGLKVQVAKNGLALAIGPEGGWREDELVLFGEAGWQFASLGRQILRCETAAIAALAIATAEIECLG